MFVGLKKKGGTTSERVSQALARAVEERLVVPVWQVARLYLLFLFLDHALTSNTSNTLLLCLSCGSDEDLYT